MTPPSAPATAPRKRAWIVLTILLVASVVVFLPAVRTPLFLDDYNQAAMARGAYPAPRGPLELYDFVTSADRARLLDRGVLPWWSDPDLQVKFLRPLSSALLWLDYRLFPGSHLPAHLHSLGWWLAATLAAAALFKRLLPARAALLATAVFALAPSHAVPLAWLANREALVSTALGIAALCVYARFREGGAARDGVLAGLLFTATLLAGEYGLCFAGYVVALELALPGQPLSARARGLALFAAPATAYLILHHRLGYGAAGIGFYADPFRDLPAFLRAAPEHLAALCVLGWVPFGPTLPAAMVLFVLASFAIAIVHVLGSLTGATRRSATWLLAGSFLALGPVLATLPSPRLLGASMLGIAGVVGLVLDHAWTRMAGDDRRGADVVVALAAAMLGVAHLALGPIASRALARMYHDEAVRFAARAESLRARLTGREGAQVVILRSAGAEFVLPFVIGERNTPPRFRVLTQTGPLLALRRDARTLDVLVAPEQTIFPMGPANLVRDTRKLVGKGEVFEVPGMRASVLEVGIVGPRSVRFELDRDLSSPEVITLVEDQRGFREIALPPPGTGLPVLP